LDALNFDRLSKALVSGGTRRGVLRLLAALPIGAVLLPPTGEEDADAHGRRKRRKKRHKHGKGRRRGKGNKKKQRCRAEPKATTCQGKCGTVKNNCKKVVDCGSCDCLEPCDPCYICQAGPNTPGMCVIDPEQQGEACGSAGQVCQADGVCACDAGSCANPTPMCIAGACQACSTDAECQDASRGDLCCGGTCVRGVCCEDDACSSDQAPDCVGNQCVCAGNDDTPCNGSKVCCADGCADLDTDRDHCGSCGNACPANEICVDGGCVACDISCPSGECDGTDLLAKMNQGGTVYICPGRYTGFFSLTANVTAIGAGQGDNETVDTILMASGAIGVRNNAGNTATLRRLRVTGARGNLASGVEILDNSSLNMVDCTVTDNISVDTGAPGVYNGNGTLTMTGCTITDNHASGTGYLYGGGIWNVGSMTLTDCDIDGNTAETGAGVFNADDSTATLTGCRITYNEAVNGGGLYNFQFGSLTLVECTVEHNEAEVVGGGITNLSGGVIVLDATSVRNNTVLGPMGGGGIYNEGAVTVQNGASVTDNEPDNCTGAPIDGCIG
jgi:hypothetical protein